MFKFSTYHELQILILSSVCRFSPTCVLEADGDVTCDACPIGFQGRRCEVCAPGYEGNPGQSGGRCEPVAYRPSTTQSPAPTLSSPVRPHTLTYQSMNVRVEEPRAQRMATGSSVTFKCSGYSTVSETSFTVIWTKEGGQLPPGYRMSEMSGSLTIADLRQEDSGVYVCTGSDLQSLAQDHATLFVEGNNYAAPTDVTPISVTYQTERTIGNSAPPPPPVRDQIVTPVPNLMDTRTAPFGSTVVLACSNDLEEPVTYSWIKLNGQLPEDTDHTKLTLTLKDIKGPIAGTYVCTAQSRTASIDVPIILAISGLVPRFAQSQLSYMSMPTLPDTYQRLEVELSLRAEKPDGLILYNGQQPYGGDFVSLGLRNSYVEFRFELGRGPILLRSERQIEMGRWTTIRIIRNKRDGILQVEGQPEITGSAPGQFVGLDLQEPLYIGAVPNFTVISRAAGFSEGFVGCISTFRIGATQLDLMAVGIQHGVSPCLTCSRNSCLNGGTCHEAPTKTGQSCKCTAGYSGDKCDKEGEACYPELCGPGGRCAGKPGQVSKCFCPLGRRGRRCENEISVQEPQFGGNSYLAYSTPSNALSTFKVTLKIKPSRRAIEDDAILLYSGQQDDGMGDFTSIAIKNNSVEFSFDTGSGPATLKSVSNILEPDQWVTISAVREFNEGTLMVGSLFPPIKGRSPGHTRGLNLRTPLYVGGVDTVRITVSPHVGVARGFDGCLAAVRTYPLNGKNLRSNSSFLLL